MNLYLECNAIKYNGSLHKYIYLVRIIGIYGHM